MTRAWIGIGSNLAGPAAQLRRAIQALQALPGTRLLASSPTYRSLAVGPGQQPDYLNAVAAIETTLPALELLHALQGIEAAQGRERLERWGPRTLDLDILLYGECIIEEPELTVPHPRMLERNFVLQPLLDIAPGLVLPDGSRLQDRAATLGHEGLWRLEQDA